MYVQAADVARGGQGGGFNRRWGARRYVRRDLPGRAGRSSREFAKWELLPAAGEFTAAARAAVRGAAGTAIVLSAPMASGS